MTDGEAVAEANRLCGITGKDFARTLIRGSQMPSSLSVAVEGGSSGLKRSGAERRATLSMHGRWSHVHAGALEATYGRAPYFQHVMPGIRAVLESAEAGEKLDAFTRRLHDVLRGFLQLYPPPETNVTPDTPERPEADVCARRGAEIAGALDPDLSLIDAVMHFGGETSLVLLHLNSKGV